MNVSLAELLTRPYDPEKVVAWRGTEYLTWQHFVLKVTGLARHLDDRPESSWLIACHDAYEFAVALFAVWHAGRRAVLPPSLQVGAIDETRAFSDGVLEGPWPCLPSSLSGDPVTLPSLSNNEATLELFTSGSSGEPKRIVKHLAQLDAEVGVLERCWGGGEGPVLATVPHNHIYGLLFRILWPLAAGRPFDVAVCATPEILLGRLEWLGRARVVSSPSQLARMGELVSLENMAGRVERIFSSGGPLPAAAATQFQTALGAAPTEILGSTETGGIAWRQQGADDAWTPLPGVSVCTEDEGELTLYSPFLSEPGPVATGDAIRMLTDGRFQFLGRLDRIVKIEEKRVSLPDMERRLAGHPWVSEATLLAMDGRRRSLGALVVPTAAGWNKLQAVGRAAMARALRAHLAAWYDTVVLPRQWRYVKSLPFNERGKLTVAAVASHFDQPE